EESKRRFVERAEDGDRHPGHHDNEPEKVDELEEAVASGDYDPLDLDIPHLIVDTTNPESIDRAAIAGFVRTRTGRGWPGSARVRSQRRCAGPDASRVRRGRINCS